MNWAQAASLRQRGAEAPNKKARNEDDIRKNKASSGCLQNYKKSLYV